MNRRRQVGVEVKRLREARGLSVSDLARASGVAKATLSALEAGHANPTLETLWALIVPLHVSLGELVDPPEPVLSVVRAGEGTRVHGKAIEARLLQSFETGTVRLEIFDVEVRSKKQISAPHPRGVIEHIVVSSGRLRVGPVDAPLELRAGDYLRMAPAWPHLYQALVRGTRMVLVMEFPRS